MHTLRLIVFTFLLTGSLAANAMNGIFWQPQDRDLSISETRWLSLMDKVKVEGFDTLVVQWTRYGDSFNSAEGNNAEKGAELLEQSDVKIISAQGLADAAQKIVDAVKA